MKCIVSRCEMTFVMGIEVGAGEGKM